MYDMHDEKKDYFPCSFISLVTYPLIERIRDENTRFLRSPQFLFLFFVYY